MSLGYHAVIRELLSTGCLYVQSAHVDYLQALGFPAAKASSGCLTNPSSEHCHTVKSALLNPLLHLFPLQTKPRHNSDRFLCFLFIQLSCNIQMVHKQPQNKDRITPITQVALDVTDAS